MAEIRLDGVDKAFAQFQLFKDLSLQVEPHTYACLLGPSGCGKTTLMRLIAGLERPDGGDIAIAGKRVNALPPHARDIGLAFQNYALYPHLSVRQNLEFPLRAPIRRKQYSPAEIDRRVMATARRLKIDGLLHRSINQLSGGQQQRVALGRAIIRSPRALLLDEPVTHLDAQLRHEMRAELKLLHRDIGATTVHITHDQQEALAVADVIVVMRAGRIEQIGSPIDIYGNPETVFVAGFIGDPPMSLLPARLVEEASTLRLDIAGVRVPLPARLQAAARTAPDPDVIVGVRLNGVALAEPGAADAIPGTVHARELVGRTAQVMFRVGTGLARYRAEHSLAIKLGDRVRLRVNLDEARLFHRATERTLRPRENA